MGFTIHGGFMRLRHLAMALSNLPPHPQSDVSLEQYATEGDFAARWIADIVQRGDLGEETRVVDLGAGNGILGIGCLLAGAASVLLVEQDSGCVHEYEGAEWLIGDIKEWSGTAVDLVIMNPPWGVQIAMADRPFLEAAFSSDARVIYLLHSAKATHIENLAKSFDWRGEVVLSGSFRIPAQYEHHRSHQGTTDVAVWRFKRN
jgi:putative methylase